MTPKKPRKFTPRQEASSAETAPERLKELADDPKLARLVAANSNAPAELLLELSRNDDKAVRKACTSNANTPVEALLKLGAQFPEQLLENPVFDLLLLAHPGVFEDLPTATLNSLLKRNQVPVELIRWAWKHRGESTLQSLLMNPNTPADVVEELCKSKDPEIQIAAELHCSQDLPVWAQNLSTDIDLYSKTVLASLLSMTTAGWWDELLDLLPSVILSSHAKCVVRFLPRLHMLSKAKNSSSQNLLSFLSHAKDWEVLYALSRNSNCPANALERLAGADKHIRISIADHNKVPSRILSALSEDLLWEVRMHVAANPATDEAPLLKLSMDVVDEVRAGVAANECAPESVLATLAADQSWLVRQFAAGNKRTPAQALLALACDGDNRVRREVALNTHLPAAIRIKLRHKDDDHCVRQNAARTLCCHNVRDTQSRAGHSHKHCFSQIASRDVNARGVSEIELRLLRILESALRSSQPSPNRRFLFTFPHCPVHFLAKNFRSRNWLERFAIAGNPSTPEAVVERMAKEGNQLVRRAAAENLARRASAPNQQLSHERSSP